MLPRLLRLHPSAYQRLVRLSKEAEREGAYRVAKRLRAVVLNSEGHTSGELAEMLQAPRSKVSEWLQRYRPMESMVCWKGIGRASSLRSGYRHLELAHDCLGDPGGVRRSVSSRACAQIASWVGIFRATAPPCAGARRCRGAGPMASPNLS